MSDSRADYWGIVVILEDAFVRREHYYRKACELLEIEENSSDWEWLTTHIKVLDLYEIERHYFTSSDILEAFKAAQAKDRYSYSLIPVSDRDENLTNSDLLRFKDKMIDDMQQILCNLST